MPLTPFQREVLRLLAVNRSPDSYLPVGAALHAQENSTRYSQDLDFFHDSEKRVAEAFQADRELLEQAGIAVDVEFSLPGNVRVTAARSEEVTRIDWAHDTAWRFFPTVQGPEGGYRLHDIDLAVNKLLALAGRDEVRDYVDVLEAHARILPLGALIWAAAGKDPGLSPHSLLELMKRRGRPRQEELDRLHLTTPLDVKELKHRWLDALASAERFVGSRPASELGCLYLDPSTSRILQPEPDTPTSDQGLQMHFGAPGGVIPVVSDPPQRRTAPP